MNYEKLFSHTVTAVLLGMAGFYESSSLAYAAVLSSAVSVVQSVYARLIAAKAQKQTLPEDAKRTIHDLGARVATLEYGVKTRGF